VSATDALIKPNFHAGRSIQLCITTTKKQPDDMYFALHSPDNIYDGMS
jgi:hypothetical protein